MSTAGTVQHEQLSLLMGDDDPLEHMRARIEMCRRLAQQITDARTVMILQQMADEGEADLKRLEAERDKR